jgi:hypothetical protein
LANIETNTEALDELKSMLSNYMAKMQDSEDVSLSVNKKAVEDLVHISFLYNTPLLGIKVEKGPYQYPRQYTSSE